MVWAGQGRKISWYEEIFRKFFLKKRGGWLDPFWSFAFFLYLSISLFFLSFFLPVPTFWRPLKRKTKKNVDQISYPKFTVKSREPAHIPRRYQSAAAFWYAARVWRPIRCVASPGISRKWSGASTYSLDSLPGLRSICGHRLCRCLVWGNGRPQRLDLTVAA